MPEKGGIAFDSLQIRFGQDVLLRQDLATIFLIRDNMGKRPIFFSWSDGGYPDQTLGLSPYLVSQGFVRKLMPTPVVPKDPMRAEPGTGLRGCAAHASGSCGMCTTGGRPRALRPRGWVDPPSGSILQLYRWSTAGPRGCSRPRATARSREAGGLGGARGEPGAERGGAFFETLVLRTTFALPSTRRGGRAVEGSGLENRQGRKSFVSSNLTHAVPHLLRRQGCSTDGHHAASTDPARSRDSRLPAIGI